LKFPDGRLNRPSDRDTTHDAVPPLAWPRGRARSKQAGVHSGHSPSTPARDRRS